jgi:hypothetical protein
VNTATNTINFTGAVSENITATVTIAGETLAGGRITVPTFTASFPLSSAPPLSDWDAVQVALNNPLITTVNLAGLTSPSDVRTLIVPANRTVTIIGNPTVTFNDVAFIFGNNSDITIRNLNIRSANNHNQGAAGAEQARGALRFLGGANTLTIEGDNTITSGQTAVSAGFGAAIEVMGDTNSLTIRGTGTLTAQGAATAAGIGTGHNAVFNSTINIEGGIINATGQGGGAGIGGGAATNNSTGSVTISGGANVIATGGATGAGIGAGTGAGGFSGTVIISGDDTIVTANRGGGTAMAIGHSGGTLYSTLTVGAGNPTINANAAIPPATGDPLATAHSPKVHR